MHFLAKTCEKNIGTQYCDKSNISKFFSLFFKGKKGLYFFIINGSKEIQEYCIHTKQLF
jgi:hypothetical protein